MATSSLPGINTPTAEQWPAPVAVWEHTGQSGQFRVRLDLIRGGGRAGAIPDVALSYQTGNQNGIFGLGWSLNIPCFSRGDGRTLPRYRDAGPSADKFSSTEFGELVPVLTRHSGQWLPDTHRVDDFEVTRFRPRVDTSFVRIERWLNLARGEDHWLTISRDNVKRIYGRTQQARIADTSNRRRMARWLLEEEIDSRGNRILFEYKPEDLAGVLHSSLPERHRLSSGQRDAQLHPKRIKWGNQHPDELGGWLFELVFDYGEHDTDAPAEHIDWVLRSDAFSDYRDGFEVRTRRLCQRALLFHHIPELGGSATLVRAHEFTYETTPAKSLLNSVTLRGFRREATGAIVSDSLPAVSFAYTTELPPGPVGEVVFTDGRTAAAATLQWHDLDGSGLPGLVSREPGGAMHYRKNLGDGMLSSPQVLTSRPSLTDTQMPSAQSLEKLFGDGRSCLIDLAEGPGFQERMQSGQWSSYTPFTKTPSVPSSAAGTRNLDLDGDGRADLMLAGQFGVRWHRFNGRDGWAVQEDVVASPAMQTALADRTGTVLLADMNGDGLADLVQVRPGSIRYWPNLGYGKFGEPVQMANSPLLDGPDLFDPARVRLFDVDGSGVADLVYLGRGAIICYANHSGNVFGPPRVISSLPLVTDLESVGVVDLLGTGTGCLVWSSVSPGRVDRPLRYIELVGGRQPHLLASIQNGQGLEVEISYTTSTRFMIDDARAGRTWHSTLPAPVALVSSVRETDLITGAAQVASWTYRHGYFDEAERETRGFAFVEQREAQHVPPDPGGSTFGARIPERVTRVWYHTGAHSERAQLVDRLAVEFYRGDPEQHAPPGLAVENEFGVLPRELLRSLRGRPIREEIFGASDGELDEHPFVTVDYGYLLRALQPSSASTAAVVAAFTQETIESTYERNPADPRVAHQLVLEVDRLGNSTRQATIAYARRRSDELEQRRTLLTLEEQQVINRDDETDWYRAAVPAQARVFEVGPLPVRTPRRLYGVEELKTLLTTSIDLPFEQALPGSGPPHRRLVGGARTQYWNEELTGPAAFGTVGPRALVYEQQRVAFSDGLLTSVYTDSVNRELLESSGYVHDEGLWWARGSRLTYSPAAFYQPLRERTPLNAEHVIEYDPHRLFVGETRDPMGNVARAEYDYQALAAATVTDPNGARVSTSFDAHGFPIAVAFAGARGEGDSLSAPTIRIARDLIAWERDRAPASLLISARVRHGDATSQWEQTVSFLDGRGREFQNKRLAEPVSVTSDGRWLVEKHAVLTSTGAMLRTYAPGFTGNDQFSHEAEIGTFPVIRARVDALGRTVETLQADGAVTTTIQTAWRVERWDANDAVRGSPWLQIRRLAGATAQETAEADAAESHRETPLTEHLDPAGRVILQMQNAGAAGLAEVRTSFTITGKVMAVTDARRVLTEQRVYDMLDRTVRVQSVASGTTRTFYDAEDKPVHAWGARGQEQRLVHDADGRLIRREVRDSAGDWSVAERLIWGEQAPADVAYRRGRLYLHYDGAGQIKLSSYDFRGRPLRTERTFPRDLTIASDWGVIRSVERAEDAERLSAPLLSRERFVTTATYDAQDRLVTRTTQDGSVTSVKFNARGLPASIAVTIDGSTTAVLQDPVYDAAGRRIEAVLGNGVRETSAYDEGRGFLKGRTTIALGGGLLRDLSFSHDAVGNVLSVIDAGQQARYFRNRVVSPDRSFRYDAFYRLIEAHGREAAIPVPPPDRSSAPPLHGIPHENDRTAVRRYRENYQYDLTGNMTELEHVAGSDGSWTIRYDIDPSADRITGLRQRDGTSIPGRYEYDAAGNALTLGGVSGFVWNEDEQLARVNLEGGGLAHYVYDATGQRAAKVVVRLDGLREERFYLGGYEVFRRVSPAGDLDQEQTALNIDAGADRLVLVERRRTAGDRRWTTFWRYQHTDQVGSSCLETDQGPHILTFEEFRSFGTTAYHATQRATLPKRYRFKSCEHDTESGLLLYGVRYYVPWLGRWISPDPGGMLDDTNRYWFARSNPVTFSDPSGLQAICSSNPTQQQSFVVRNNVIGVYDPIAGVSRALGSVGPPQAPQHWSWSEQGGWRDLTPRLNIPQPTTPAASPPVNSTRSRRGHTRRQPSASRNVTPSAPTANSPPPTTTPPHSSTPEAAASISGIPTGPVTREEIESWSRLVPPTSLSLPVPPEMDFLSEFLNLLSEFLARGGNHIVLGLLGIGIGMMLLSLGPVGWAALLPGLTLMGGGFRFGYGMAELLTSGNRTPVEEAEINRRGETASNFLSPVGWTAGAITYVVTGGDQRATERNAETFARAEGIASLGVLGASQLPRVAQSLPRAALSIRFRIAAALDETGGTASNPSAFRPQVWGAPVTGNPATALPNAVPRATPPIQNSPSSPPGPANRHPMSWLAYYLFGFDNAAAQSAVARQALNSIMPRVQQPGMWNIVRPGSHYGAYGNRSRRFLTFFDVVAHGNTEVVAEGVRVGNAYGPTRFAGMMRSNPLYNQGNALTPPQPVRLLACNTGTDPLGFAQQLADELGTIVMAPRSFTYAHPSGQIRSYPVPRLDQPGGWTLFFPRNVSNPNHAAWFQFLRDALGY